MVAQSRKSTCRNRNGIIMKKLNDKLKLVTEKIRKRMKSIKYLDQIRNGFG